MYTRIGIQTKIVVPFISLFLLAFVVLGSVTLGLVSRGVEDSIQRQVEDVAAVISQAGFTVSDSFLAKIRSAFRVEVATSTLDGHLHSCTLGDQQARPLENLLRGRGSSKELLEVRLGSESYKCAHSLVKPARERGPKYRLYFLFPLSRIAAAKARAIKPIGVLVLIGSLLTAALGIVIARTITRPIRALADASRRIAAGALDQRTTVETNDEVGELAKCFNTMIGSLAASQNALIRSERLAAVGQFAAGVAHEIRNPLTSIKMTVQLLRKAEEADVEALDLMLNELERLELCIDELLSFARPLSLACEESRVQDLLDDTLALLARQLDHAHVEIVREYEDGLPAAYIDRNKLKQVFVNLILNALQAMPRQGQLTVRARSLDDPARLRVEFCDTGAGIPADVADKVFDPFFTTRENGTGLGLALARAVVEEHGGDIGLTTGPHGTTFWVQVPVRARSCRSSQ